MRQRQLGRTALSIPEIGFGTYRLEDGVAPIQRAIELGATFIDTAELYRNEALVGEAIQDRRDQVFIATKLRALRYDDVLRSADASLRKLKTDVIDLYQVHVPDAAVPIAETFAALNKLVEMGKVRYLGVSNFSVPELKAAQAASARPIVSNQVVYNVVERSMELDVIPYCEAQGITVIAYSPLAQGLAAIRARDPKGALEAIAQQTGRSIAQIALRWCLRHPTTIVIPKAGSLAHVEENCGASDFDLPSELAQRIDTELLPVRRSRLYQFARRTVRSWRQRLKGPRVFETY
ncbi:MAG: aldo/keto reductase [Verrucomicrobiales bacterium]|nr:aldo/keto reductase [Verrucomicrobiales bacterium]